MRAKRPGLSAEGLLAWSAVCILILGSSGLFALSSSASVKVPFVRGGPIRVVLDDNYPPYCFRGDSGQPEGILVDQWRLWAKRTGVAVELLAVDWSEAQSMILSGRADVIDTIFRTPERDKLYDFTPAYVSIDVPVFFSRNLSGIASVRDLRGFTVGVKKGDACIGILRAAGIESLRLYPNYESVVRAAAAGDILVFCVDRPPGLYYIYKFGLQDRFRSALSLYTGKFHRAVLKGRTELLELVERGFSSISPAEYDRINRTWLGRELGSPAYFRYVAWAAAILAVLLVVIGLWSFLLRRTVRLRTKELREAVAQLTETKAEAERASRVKGEFLSNMSHEIRTPLNGIVGMANLLGGTRLDAEQSRYVEMLTVSARLLGGIVNDVLDLAKIESGTRVLRPEATSIRTLIESLLQGFRLGASERSLELRFSAAADLPEYLLVDPTALSQVAINLLGNALKFTERGSVELRLGWKGSSDERGTLVLDVKDTGIGIPQESLAEIFERFTQVESHSAKKRQGTGLGLAIASELVRLMGGRLDVASELGRGSTFTAEIPAVPTAALEPAAPAAALEPAAPTAALEPAAPTAALEPAAQADATSPAAVAGPDASAAASGSSEVQALTPDEGAARSYRVLAVEDNRINLLYLERLLAKAGFQVETAADGRSAVASAVDPARSFDLAIMDIQMPEMDGIEALRAIRGSGIGPERMPIIALTGYALEKDRQRFLEAGFSAVVVKPFDGNVLVDLALRTIGESSSSRSRASRVEGENHV